MTASVIPKVSVCVITYNHAKFVEECLDSILSQEVHFDFELIVGDDCSDDGTRAILERYQRTHPSTMKLVLQESRTGGSRNYEDVHALATGEYVAHVDGDDVLLPGKLQKQVDLLDADPELNIVWHPVVIFAGATDVAVRPKPSASYLGKRITRRELAVYGPFGPHSSTMYRRIRACDRDRHFHGNDWFISVELIGEGKGLMMMEPLAKYRVHSSGLSGGAVASTKNRKLLCRCQLGVISRYPDLRSLIALRALVLALLDASKGKGFFIHSLDVFFRCRAFPDLTKLPELLEFFKTSKRPAIPPAGAE